MSIIEKIKLFVKAAKPLGQFVNQVKGAKLRYKTIPFWLSIVGSLSAIVASLAGFIPATTGVVITAALGAAYNILRGLDKMNQEGIKPPLLSTEFWVGIGTIILASLTEIQGAGVDAKVLTLAISIISAAMAVAQNLGAYQPPKVDSGVES